MDNPFLFARDPYHDNPLRVLAIVEPGARTAVIRHQADTVERYAQADLPFPETDRREQPGEAGRAAQVLSHSVQRLAFDVMYFGLPDEDMLP